MRVRKQNDGISVNAIGGLHVVLLGMNCSDAKRDGLLGFSIFRKDATESEGYYLDGFKTFKQIAPNPTQQTVVSLKDNPAQTFLWGDYTAKPDHNYTYTVTAMYGASSQLTPGPAVDVTVQTQSNTIGKHGVFFNRGVIGSQAFVNKFGEINLKTDIDGTKYPAAWQWLSRGLEEAMLAFIARASGKSYALRAAVYEFTYQPVLAAFKAADKAGANVQIICHLRTDPTGAGNKKALDKAGLKAPMIIPRTKPGIAHNKFIVLLKDGKPIAVWTGSTNITDNGIFGQSNVGHQIEDLDLAADYLAFWKRLQSDPSLPDTRTGNMTQTPDPAEAPASDSMTPYFSSRTRKTTKAAGSSLLEWYGERVSAANSLICFTAAFGVTTSLQEVLGDKKNILRLLLLEKPDAHLAALNDPTLSMAIGTHLKDPVANRMLAEISNTLAVNVAYVHNKFLLVDPLGDHPLVVTGSANFSPNSVENNDENMVVIQDDTEVADVYLGEFMRMYTHFWARDFLNDRAKGTVKSRDESLYLTPDDSWTAFYFKKGTRKFAERTTFA